MQGILKVIVGFLGLKPLYLAAIALSLFGAGIYLQADENKTNLMKADALLAGPPAPVAVGAAAQAAAAHPFGEVMVQAQLDMSMDYEITLTGDGADRVGYMVPLVAADAETPEVLGVLLYDDKGLTPDAVTDLMLGPTLDSDVEGAFGPVLMLNGMIGDMGDFEKAVAEVFASEGRTLPADVPVLRSFEGDRVGAYDPDWPFEQSIFGIFAWLAGAVGLYALFRSAVRMRKREADAPVALDDSPDLTDEDHAFMAGVAAQTT